MGKGKKCISDRIIRMLIITFVISLVSVAVATVGIVI